MKKLSLKIVVAAFFLVVGTMSLSAQIGRGGECLNTGNTGTCLVEDGVTCTSVLTEDQQAVLKDLFVDYQAEMDLLRTAMRSASLTEKLVIRKEMIVLRDAHREEVQALLAEWGL
jgi:hypothetical protein